MRTMPKTGAPVGRPGFVQRFQVILKFLRRALRGIVAVALFLVSGPVVALAASLAGVGLAVAGVYILAGLGWALLAGSAPTLLFAAILIRGLARSGA